PGGPRPNEPQVEIRISDGAGKVLRTMKGPAKLGVNRAAWDLGRDQFRQPPRGERGDFFRRDSGPQVPPGTYNVTIRFRGHEAKGTVRVAADPSSHNTDADWQTREAAVRRIGELQDSVVEAIDRVRAARADLDVVVGKLRRADAREEEKKKKEGTDTPAAAPGNPLLRSARGLRRKLDAEERRLFVPPNTKGIVDDRTPINRVQLALFSLDSSWDPPNPTQRAELQQAETATAAALQEVNRLLSEDVAAFRKQVAEAHVDLLPAETPLELPRQPAP
ncbi:MAG TPA: hypothetical protein VOA80_24090, partial [Thermoanaerobaculia bacterium]|nr:hypothetical protein [Thermoanaerobaculia bacterium]